MFLQFDSGTEKSIRQANWRSHIVFEVEHDIEFDIETESDQLTEDEEEPRARVIIHNDDITPMDFVVVILQRIFHLTPLESEHVMIVAHFTGMAYVCTLPLSEAKKRVGKAHFAAQLEGYPLTFSIEPE